MFINHTMKRETNRSMIIFRVAVVIIAALYISCLVAIPKAGGDVWAFISYATPFMLMKTTLAWYLVNLNKPVKQQTNHPDTFLGERPCKEMEFQPQSQEFDHLFEKNNTLVLRMLAKELVTYNKMNIHRIASEMPLTAEEKVFVAMQFQTINLN
jgi:hypothetical protein